VGIPDVICTGLEIVSIVLFLVLGRRARPVGGRRLGRLLATSVPACLLTAALTWTAVDSVANDMPVALDVAPPAPGVSSTSVVNLMARPGSQPVDRFTLTPQARRIDGRTAWAYDGTVPGPTLRVRQGDRVEVTLVNHLPVSTTIHWHGIRVPNAEDGVAGLTQNAVPPGGRFTYQFLAQDAGTYWYHSHQDTATQIPQGLFGALVVEPARPLAVTRDDTVLLHTLAGTSTPAVNGSTHPSQLDANPGDVVRLRLINAVAPGMDGGPQVPVLVGAPYRVVALDGHDLNDPGSLGPERLALGMGQREDLQFTMPAQGSVKLLDPALEGAKSGLQRTVADPSRNGPTVTIGSGPPPSSVVPARLPLFDATTYGTPAPDPVASRHAGATYPIVLQDQPGLRDGTIQLVHTINGQASPSVPPIVVSEGELVRLHIVNRTNEYHPMHLHGHVFSVIAKDGRPIQGSPLHLDTVLVAPGETWDVAFLADNPGIWMFHCHVLLHASMGMTMTIDYRGVTTPFEMGSRSGNNPE
jgi:FtsP/CotA-like multicopper oxidase with cupredoxin domain